MVRPRLIVAGVLMLVVVGNAWAESSLLSPSRRTRYWEFSIQTRYVGSQDFEASGGARLSVEDDLGWGFNLGYNLDERFNIGGFFSWRTVDYNADIVNADNPLDTRNYNGWLDTANMGLNATWNVLPKRFTPYLQGSIGWAMLDTNIPAEIDYGCYWDPWWGYICGDYATTYGEDAFSYALGAGVSLQLTDAFLIRAGYEKSWIDTGTADGWDMFRLDLGFLYR